MRPAGAAPPTAEPAVGVGPLQIVDVGDDGRPLPQGAEELTEDDEHRGTDLARVGADVLVRRVGDERDTAQDRKRLQQDRRPIRERSAVTG